MGYWTMLSEPTIGTVGSTFSKFFVGSGPKHHTDILKGITGINIVKYHILCDPHVISKYPKKTISVGLDTVYGVHK